jgi:hypothetical protein
MSFDLDISHYSLDDLKEMFGLASEYSSLDLDKREKVLNNNVRASKDISKDEIERTIVFLTSAKTLLLLSVSVDASLPQTQSPFLSIAQNQNQKPQTVPINAMPSEFFAGTLNPLKKRTLTKNVNIDTRFRSNYSTTDSCNFHTTLPTTIRDVLTMAVSSVELPTTFYNVSSKYGNNYFFLDINYKNELNEDSTSRDLFEIPSGKYNSNGLLTMMNAVLATMGVPFSQLTFAVNVSDTGSGTGLFHIAGEETITKITLDFASGKNAINVADEPCTGSEMELPRKLGWILGFRNGLYTDAVSHISEGILDLSGNRYLYLAVDDFNHNVDNSFFGMFEHSLLNKTVLARIAVKSVEFSIVTTTQSVSVFPVRAYYGPVNINKLNVQLLDEYGRVIDLNHMDFSFCITVETAYDI